MNIATAKLTSLSVLILQPAISQLIATGFTMHAQLVPGLTALSLASLAQARPSPSNTLVARGDVSNTVWCGPVLATSATKVSAEWTVPTVFLPDPNAQSTPDLEFYQWVGIDGVGTSNCPEALLQGGTSQVWNPQAEAFTYDVWFEFWTPQNKSSWHMAEPPIAPGDNVRVTVTAISSRMGTVLIENLTQNREATYQPQAAGNYPLCFQHVEWVNEAPTSLLPSFPDFSFSSLSACDSNGRCFNATGSDLWYLDSAGNQCSSTLSKDGNSVYYTNAPPS